MKASSVALFAVGAAAAAPSDFTIKISTPENGAYYLAKGASGKGTQDVKNVASCKITAKTELVCDGVTIGASYLEDMSALTKNNLQTITDGWKVGDDGSLHWLNKGFRLQKDIAKYPSGEVEFGLYPKNGGVELWTLLGCPNKAGDVHDFHSMLTPGTAITIPLAKLSSEPAPSGKPLPDPAPEAAGHSHGDAAAAAPAHDHGAAAAAPAAAAPAAHNHAAEPAAPAADTFSPSTGAAAASPAAPAASKGTSALLTLLKSLFASRQ